MKPRTYEEVRAFLLDGGRTRKARRNDPTAPLYVADGDPDADEYYVLTDAGVDEVAPYLSLTRRERCEIKARWHRERREALEQLAGDRTESPTAQPVA